jgi:hypothetical protein
MQYVTKRYSFKIYHKGTEFKRHDKKELLKSTNPLRIPLTYLEEEADKILRYEMTCRPAMINYVFAQNFLESKKKSENPAVQSHVLFKFLQKLVRLTDIRKNKAFQSWLNGSKKFTLSSASDHPEVVNELIQENRITFDAVIFNLLYKEFKQRVDAYQVSQIKDMHQIIARIKEYNELQQIKKNAGLGGQIKDSYRLVSVGLLSQYMDNWQELKRFLPKSTFYDLRADLKKIGIDETTQKLQLPTPRLDYFDFFLFVNDPGLSGCLVRY